MSRRNGWVWLAVLSVAWSVAQSAPQAVARTRDPYPKAAAAYATMVDGELLWGRNLDARRSPASLTKLLTALVVLDTPGWSPDALLDVSATAAHVQRTRVGLHAGDRVRAEDALTAMLVHSANDACMVLAESYGPSVERFVARMNARAAALGLNDSHFAQPCGLDAPGQYSTARDLLTLAQAAHADERIARITATETATIVTQNQHELSFHNTNQLLGSMGSVIGLKTGFTSTAGRCLIAVAQQDGHKVWVVLLNARQRWGTARRIIDAAFASAQRTQLANRASGPGGGTTVFATAGAGLMNSDAGKTR
ncbi:MAG: serine hydrolase [Steroidobacteraceae bacterium]